MYDLYIALVPQFHCHRIVINFYSKATVIIASSIFRKISTITADVFSLSRYKNSWKVIGSRSTHSESLKVLTIIRSIRKQKKALISPDFI